MKTPTKEQIEKIYFMLPEFYKEYLYRSEFIEIIESVVNTWEKIRS